MDNLRFIVNELNKLFNTDYNMLSFGSLSDAELLAVLMNVLSSVGATTKIDVHKNLEQAIMNILMALQSIKYVPEQDIPSSDFREGLLLAKRNIIHPILHWILSDLEKVKQRVYFATYVEKCEIPPELLGDPEVEPVNSAYDKLIEEFWTCYKENAQEQRRAEEASELAEDTKKMSADMAFLLQRVDMQHDKLRNVPNRDGLLDAVRAYRAEVKQKERLTQQLSEQQNLLLQMSADIKGLQSTASQNAGRRPAGDDAVEHIRAELQINKILVEGELPREHEEIAVELKAFEKVAEDGEPLIEEMDMLNNEMEALSESVQTLVGQKVSLTNAGDDQLLPFRNQAAIIAGRKVELSNAVVKLKTQSQQVVAQIGERMSALRDLVGGDLLHGDELKVFIGGLRDRSIVYKQCRAHLQGLQALLGAATRTLEILHAEDPTLVEALRTTKMREEAATPATNDIAEMRTLCRQLHQEASRARAHSASIHDELVALRRDFEAFNDDFYIAKKDFDNATDNVTATIEKLEQSFGDLEESIERAEEEWKTATKRVEAFEVVVHKYNAEVASADGAMNAIQQLTGRLRVQEKTKKDLQNQIERLQQMKEMDQVEFEQLQRVKQMILFKLEQPV